MFSQQSVLPQSMHSKTAKISYYQKFVWPYRIVSQCHSSCQLQQKKLPLDDGDRVSSSFITWSMYLMSVKPRICCNFRRKKLKEKKTSYGKTYVCFGYFILPLLKKRNKGGREGEGEKLLTECAFLLERQNDFVIFLFVFFNQLHLCLSYKKVMYTICS